MEMADTVSLQHAIEICDLVKYTFYQNFEDPSGPGLLDLTRGMVGSQTSSRSKKVKFYEVLRAHAQRVGKTTLSMSEIKEVAAKCSVANVHAVVDSLNMNGFLMLTGPSEYKIVAP